MLSTRWRYTGELDWSVQVGGSGHLAQGYLLHVWTVGIQIQNNLSHTSQRCETQRAMVLPGYGLGGGIHPGDRLEWLVLYMCRCS